MNEALSLALAWAAGGSLGAIFFGGLWWTVRKGVSSERPALWFVASVVLRSGIVLVGFYLVSSGDWRGTVRNFVCGRAMNIVRPWLV